MGGGAWGRGGSDVAMAAWSMTAGRRKHLALFTMALPLLSWHEIKSKVRTEKGLEMIRCCRLGRCFPGMRSNQKSELKKVSK